MLRKVQKLCGSSDGAYGIFIGINFTHVVISCNSAHMFADSIDAVLNRPITSLLGLTKLRVSELNLKQVGLLASPTSLKTKLFHECLIGITEVKCLSNHEQSLTERLIRSVIAEKSDSFSELRRQVELFDTPVILGCTELSVANDCIQLPNIIDPIQLATEKIFST